MRERLIRFALAAGTVVLIAGPAPAADPAKCDAYAKDAAKAAQEVRNLACGFNLNDPMWSSTDPDPHRRWCLFVKAETVDAESDDRRDQVDHCKSCRAYAKAAVQAAADNLTFGCGFKGPEWDTNEQDHYNWCMQRGERPVYLFGVDVASNNSWLNDEDIGSETGARDLAIQQCKLTHKEPVSCHTMCHSSNSASRALIPASPGSRLVPKSGGAIRASTQSSSDPKGRGTSANDLGKSVRQPPSSRIIGPGLLENDGGFGRQGPAATGVPAPPSAPVNPNYGR